MIQSILMLSRCGSVRFIITFFSIGNLIDTNLISSNNNRNELSEQAVGQGFVLSYEPFS